MVLCVVISLITAPPRLNQVTDELTFNWKKFNFGGDLGGAWYKNIVFWWAVSFAGMVGFMIIFGVIL